MKNMSNFIFNLILMTIRKDPLNKISQQLKVSAQNIEINIWKGNSTEKKRQ
jgi:hypothetical protein